MSAQIRSAADNEAKVALTRNKLVLEQARAIGLLGTAKNTRLSGRVPSELIDAAKKRAHVTSDTELLELALSRLALEDDFGVRLVRRKGSIPSDIDLGILISQKPSVHSNLRNARERLSGGSTTICLGSMTSQPSVAHYSWTSPSIWTCCRGDRRERWIRF